MFYLFYPVVGIVIATLLVRYLVRDNISEGVTRVLYAMSQKGSHKPRNCYSSILASSATIGFGGSVGPEAPIVLAVRPSVRTSAVSCGSTTRTSRCC
ncbi:MAG: chloride channel protein [Alistipes onderdonkii]